MAIIDNYSKEELNNIVCNSYSIAEVIDKLGYSTKNGRNSNTIKKRLQKYNIDTSHFKTVSPIIRTRDEIFQNNSGATQNTVRRWFKKENVDYKCSICGQEPIWNGQPLIMILDHKNGNKNDHRLENLRYVCPNCNQQLVSTGFKGYVYNENGLKIKHTSKTDKAKYFCIDCGTPISRGATRCKPCSYINRRKDPIDKKNKSVFSINRDKLKSEIRKKPFLQIGKDYGVSDNAIRKWCKKLNLPYKSKDIKKYSEEEWKNI